ncbi:MAG TPA: hypothetical protein VM325_17235 [Alphaproteobacteria bacterium]|nr:hypothetical protein [Alphaproteobacteria bacterium]
MNAELPLASNRALQVVEPVAEPAEDKTDTEHFDWERDKDDIAVSHQMPIAVYPNCRGEVVVRQRGDICDEDDHFVVVRHTDARSLADAIMREAGAAEEAANRPAPTLFD